MTRMTARYAHTAVDVAIVGGGAVGLSIASALRATSMRVMVVDPHFTASAVAHRGPAPDLRVWAVSPASERFLESIGAWQAMDATRIKQYTEMKVWDWFTDGRIRFDHQEYGIPHLGSIVENQEMVQALASTIQESNVKVVESHVIDVAQDADRVDARPQICLANGDTVEAALLVGADGADSAVKKFCHFESHGKDYGQMGVVCSIELEDEVETAWQRFLPNGPLALLPSFDRMASIVWTTTPSDAKALLSCTNQEFMERVNKAFRMQTSEFQQGSRFFRQPLPSDFAQYLPVLFPEGPGAAPPKGRTVRSKRASFPLRLRHSSSYSHHRIVLAGDAAHVVHPLAGQGVNIGLSDAAFLTSKLKNASALGLDIGSVSITEEYDQHCRLQNAARIRGIDAIHALFAIQDGPLALFRGMGLHLIDNIPGIKKILAETALGHV